MLIAVISGLSHKLSLIRMMTETTRHAKYSKSSGLNRSLENLVAHLCNYKKGEKKSNNQNMCEIPELCHGGLAESWMRNFIKNHLEPETTFNKWIYCLVWGTGLLFCLKFKFQLKYHLFPEVFPHVPWSHLQEHFSLSLSPLQSQECEVCTC